MKPAPPTSGTFIIGDTELPYTLQRSRKRKRTVAFAIQPERGLCITAPLATKVPVIEKMVTRRAAWIFKKIAAFKFTKPRAFISGETIPFLGTEHPLHVTRDSAQKTGCALVENVLQINIQGAWLSD